MNKTLSYTLGVIVVVIIAFLLVRSYASFGGANDEQITKLSPYFRDRMIALGVADIGQPIEGFDANLLIMAFPGLLPEDFEGVEALEGSYKIDEDGDEISFVRGENMPITSAERMVSEKGYETLLRNVSDRFDISLSSEKEVDELIAKIDTGERVEIRINEEGSALGVKITPRELLEDSRCPADVACVWAGTVKIRASLESGLGATTQIFELNKPITTEAEEVKLASVSPFPETGRTIRNSDYVFYFEIKKR